jgi:hypothetical protein
LSFIPFYVSAGPVKTGQANVMAGTGWSVLRDSGVMLPAG